MYNKLYQNSVKENQDGSVGRHTAPPVQPELTENRTARKSDTKEIKNKHSSRPVGGAETGSRSGEDWRGHGGTETGGVWDERDRQSDHWQTLRPHIRADKLRGPESEWRKTGQAERWVAPRGPHTCTQINREEQRRAKQTAYPGIQCGEIKPQNL